MLTISLFQLVLEHRDHICQVLSCLQSACLTINMTKCQWGQMEVDFFSHVVGIGKVSPADCKIQAVQAFIQHKTKTQVRQFLGLTRYYLHFIQHYAEHTFSFNRGH